MPFLIFLGVVIVVALFVIGIYNSLVKLRQRFRNAFAQIDVQLKRRYDLIPNLVETAKGYMAHERDTLEAVISARSGAVSAQSAATATPGDPSLMKKLAGAEKALGGALGRLFAVSERYPDLKANQNMMQLSSELKETEDKLAYARQSYNDAVMDYNTGIELFPNNLIANSFAFLPAELWELDEEEIEAAQKAPEVKF